MPSDEWIALVNDIRDAIRKIERCVSGVNWASFQQSDEKIAAVERWIITIGEAAHHLSEDVRDHCPDVPWSQIIGMRHIVVHAYRTVKLEVIWKTVHDDLPPLDAALKQLLDSHS